MAEITINLTPPLNKSVQAGDIAYYTKTQTSGEWTIQSGSMIRIGKIKKITLSDNNDDEIVDNAALLCFIAPSTTPPEVGDFILFAKDRGVNEASLLGYFGEFVYSNNSKKPADLFQAGCDITASS